MATNQTDKTKQIKETDEVNEPNHTNDMNGTKEITMTDSESTFVNSWKPEFTSRWADASYLQTESYRRVTAEKEAASVARKKYEEYQSEVKRIAEMNKGKGAGTWGDKVKALEGANHAKK